MVVSSVMAASSVSGRWLLYPPQGQVFVSVRSSHWQAESDLCHCNAAPEVAASLVPSESNCCPSALAGNTASMQQLGTLIMLSGCVLQWAGPKKAHLAATQLALLLKRWRVRQVSSLHSSAASAVVLHG